MKWVYKHVCGEGATHSICILHIATEIAEELDPKGYLKISPESFLTNASVALICGDAAITEGGDYDDENG